MKKIIFLIGVVFIGGFIFYNTIEFNDDLSHFDYKKNQMDNEDSLIIKKSELNKIDIKKIVSSKIRNPIKFYLYDNKYNFFITRIDMKQDKPLDETIMFDEKLTSTNTLKTYLVIKKNEKYEINVMASNSEEISNIIFSLAGDGKQLKRVVYNKNFISYCLPMYTFSLQYENRKNPIDIFVGTNESRIITRNGVPFIISFYKKGKSIYLFLMTPINDNVKLDENILGKIINTD